MATTFARVKPFSYSVLPEPHKARTKMILKHHPEITGFFSRNPFTFLIMAGCSGFQFSAAWWLKDKPLLWTILGAYLVGAFVAHALFVVIHEAAHNLIFRSVPANKLTGILANLPSLIPSAISFRMYHLKHHAHQGDPALDADLPFEWEARLVGNSALRKALWLLLFPLFQALRPMRIRAVRFMDGWVLANWIANFSVIGFVAYFWGGHALAYLFFSFMFSIGLHPLGARWIQEHYVVSPPQETYSYYGLLNKVQMNIGYHNEHHDFISVPWNKLPMVRKTAQDYYDNLNSHNSWIKLLWRFITDPNISLYDRVVRIPQKSSSPKA